MLSVALQVTSSPDYLVWKSMIKKYIENHRVSGVDSSGLLCYRCFAKIDSKKLETQGLLCFQCKQHVHWRCCDGVTENDWKSVRNCPKFFRCTQCMTTDTGVNKILSQISENLKILPSINTKLDSLRRILTSLEYHLKTKLQENGVNKNEFHSDNKGNSKKFEQDDSSEKQDRLQQRDEVENSRMKPMPHLITAPTPTSFCTHSFSLLDKKQSDTQEALGKSSSYPLSMTKTPSRKTNNKSLYEHYKIPVSSKRVTSYIPSSSSNQNEGNQERHHQEEKEDEKSSQSRTQEHPDSLRQKSNSVRVKTEREEDVVFDIIALRQHREQETESVRVPPHPPPRPATLLKMHEMINIHDYTNTKGFATEFIQRASSFPFSGVSNFRINGKSLAVKEPVLLWKVL